MKTTSQDASTADSLVSYLGEINKYALLTVDEEQRLARAFKAGDAQAAHKMVTANLRFVVKIAYEYRSYGLKMSDLIQEGNIGLMKAVQKFDADKGIRLISYGVWWIRAYVQNYVLTNWSLVKIGTTQAQRKLFFSLARTRREIEKYNASEGAISDANEIAKRLHVKPSEVLEMQERIGGRDSSLDAPIGEDGGESRLDLVASNAASVHDVYANEEESGLINRHVAVALARLDPRERFIMEQRVMADEPMTLLEVGEHFGFSRERARQLEIRAKDKLRGELKALMAEVEPEYAYAD